MEEIDIREERCVQVEVPIGGKRRRPIDGRSDGHGPKFVGIYAQLLMRYLRAPADALITSLHAAGIELDMQAKPVFIDERPTTGARGPRAGGRPEPGRDGEAWSCSAGGARDEATCRPRRAAAAPSEG
jgi:hypothetical protein